MNYLFDDSSLELVDKELLLEFVSSKSSYILTEKTIFELASSLDLTPSSSNIIVSQPDKDISILKEVSKIYTNLGTLQLVPGDEGFIISHLDDPITSEELVDTLTELLNNSYGTMMGDGAYFDAKEGRLRYKTRNKDSVTLDKVQSILIDKFPEFSYHIMKDKTFLIYKPNNIFLTMARPLTYITVNSLKEFKKPYLRMVEKDNYQYKLIDLINSNSINDLLKVEIQK